MGGYEHNKDGVVVNALNGLPFDCIDAEHWLCKAWIAIKKTFNHYRNSLVPWPLDPSYHPIRLPYNVDEKDVWCDQEIQMIMENIVTAFEDATKKNSW